MLLENGAYYWQGFIYRKGKRGKILAEAVVQACRTDILVHVIIKVCPCARLSTYLSPLRFLSLNVNDTVLPLDFVSH